MYIYADVLPQNTVLPNESPKRYFRVEYPDGREDTIVFTPKKESQPAYICFTNTNLTYKYHSLFQTTNVEIVRFIKLKITKIMPAYDYDQIQFVE